jgi:hypothetical protein
VYVFRWSIAVLLPLILVAAQPARAQPCKCIDVGDIKQRIKEATTAVSAYSTEMQKMMEQIQRTREPIPYTPGRREMLQGRVQQAVNQVAAGRISATPSIKGENPGGTSNVCTVTINLHPSATACMRESVKRHEQHHQEECLKTLSVGKVRESAATGKDRFERDGFQLMQYAQEEIGGYTVELMFLNGELARLTRSEECNPKPKPEVRDYSGLPRERKARP